MSLKHEDGEGGYEADDRLETYQNAAVKVITGTATFAALAGLSASTYGVITSRPAIPLAFASAVNTGAFSFSFFSIREYIIHPWLIPPTDFLSHPHTHNLNSTFLSGFASGTALTYLAARLRNERTRQQQPPPSGPGAQQRRLPPSLIKSGFTLALGCTLVQVIFNELSWYRIHLLTSSEQQRHPVTVTSLTSTSTTSPSETDLDSTLLSPETDIPTPITRETFSERSDRLISTAFTKTKQWFRSWNPGIHQVDRSEYETMLKNRLEYVQRELDRVKTEQNDLVNVQRGERTASK